MGLYGIYGSHTTEVCPLFNTASRRLLLEAAGGPVTTSGSSRCRMASGSILSATSTSPSRKDDGSRSSGWSIPEGLENVPRTAR